MLHNFLATNRTTLIDRCRLMVAERSGSKVIGKDAAYGIPIFLDQLIETLSLEQGLAVSAPLEAVDGAAPEVGKAAAFHGRDLLKHGFTLEQVVRDYGDVCQAVTNLAFETGAPIEVDEFRTFNRCLDNAIAGAVTAYARQSADSETNEARISNTRLGVLAHELRNHLHTASLVIKAIKTGNVGISGATGAVLDRSILGMRHLIDQALASVRLSAGAPPRLEVIQLTAFLGQMEASASLDAHARGLRFSVAAPEKGLAVLADTEMLTSAVNNLLQNAFKFTQRQTEVILHVYSTVGRVLIEVEDHCGGLPGGSADRLFAPFVQVSENRSGIGLGLDICRRNVEANGGILKVQDVPGSGCIFTIDLPLA